MVPPAQPDRSAVDCAAELGKVVEAEQRRAFAAFAALGQHAAELARPRFNFPDATASLSQPWSIAPSRETELLERILDRLPPPPAQGLASALPSVDTSAGGQDPPTTPTKKRKRGHPSYWEDELWVRMMDEIWAYRNSQDKRPTTPQLHVWASKNFIHDRAAFERLPEDAPEFGRWVRAYKRGPPTEAEVTAAERSQAQ